MNIFSTSSIRNNDASCEWRDGGGIVRGEGGSGGVVAGSIDGSLEALGCALQ